MVLDEDALEAMLRRGDGDGSKKGARAELTERSNEFEVYERPRKDAAPATQVAPDVAAEVMPPAFQPPVADPLTPPAPPSPPTHAPTAPAAPSPYSAPPASEHGGHDCHIALLQCDFNSELTDRMAGLAVARIAAAGATLVHHVHVPGVYDAPLMAQTLARRKDVDAVVVLGVVVKGDTQHDEVITHATARKLQDIACDTETPVALGITGPGMSWAEAEARVGNAEHAVDAAVAQVLALRAAT